jgi:hypothetical protein
VASETPTDVISEDLLAASNAQMIRRPLLVGRWSSERLNHESKTRGLGQSTNGKMRILKILKNRNCQNY